MKRRFKLLFIIIVILLGLSALGARFYLQEPKFGALPEGTRLAKIQSSPNYVNDHFANPLPTPRMVNGNPVSTMWNFLFSEKERPAPLDDIPSVKVDLSLLPPNEDTVIWLGHSSYFIRVGGKTFLIDPVFSDSAAPVNFANKAFPGSNAYTASDMPSIDYLLVSHDHWDHLDYPSVIALKEKVGKIICPLGVGTYFEQWGFSLNKIHEDDWFTELQQENGLSIHILPARHYSSRLLTQNKTLWAGFAIVTPQRRIFISGDSGYGPHFATIAEKFGSFDLAILENGQYDKNWPYIHMTPEEAIKAASDLKATSLLPAHSGKFALANHPWDEPLKRISTAISNTDINLLTPIIGEPLTLNANQKTFSRWWEKVH